MEELVNKLIEAGLILEAKEVMAELTKSREQLGNGKENSLNSFIKNKAKTILRNLISNEDFDTAYWLLKDYSKELGVNIRMPKNKDAVDNAKSKTEFDNQYAYDNLNPKDNMKAYEDFNRTLQNPNELRKGKNFIYKTNEPNTDSSKISIPNGDADKEDLMRKIKYKPVNQLGK